jgi:Family of unknown function (DUF6152)
MLKERNNWHDAALSSMSETRNFGPAEEQMSRVLKYVVMAIAAMLTASSALAHHSFAMFDQSKTVTVQGTVKDFRWTNPHVFIQLLVKNESGGEDEWSIEMTSPEHLARVGWVPGTLKAGDRVTLVIHPMRDDVKGGQYLSGIGPDGPLIGSPAPKGDGK